MPNLYPYQHEIFTAISKSVYKHQGLTFSVEIARQGGKNELSAQLERSLLMVNAAKLPKNLVKCSPTFKPQTVISMSRLKDRLDEEAAGKWTAEMGYMIRLGNARAVFLSAEESASVVGHTAQILLEIDESQDVGKEKYTKEFKPMGATSNVTTVHYGTTWDETTLLEEVKQTNLELERKDGIKRHFRYDWQEVAKYNPEYRAYVEGERQRLGSNHPLFLTQYCLLPVQGGGNFLSTQQRAQLQGSHTRQRLPSPGKIYVAGIDLAGEAEGEGITENLELRTKNLETAGFRPSAEGRNDRTEGNRDSTVVTIGEVVDVIAINSQLTSNSWEPRDGIGNNSQVTAKSLGTAPGLRIVEHYRWTGKKHADLYTQLVDILKNVWHCKRVVVDATGVGQPVASFLKEAIGSAVVPFTFTQPAKSELGFNLLAAIDSGRLKMYSADNSAEYKEFWKEMERAKSHYRASQTMNFYVDPNQGHDDFLMSLALAVEAANEYSPRNARGR